MPLISSPRTQALSSSTRSGPPEQAKNLFGQGLSQMAYDVLLTRLPNVAPDVVTFKVLETDPDAGNGTGAFVLSRGNQIAYVPVVMAQNQMKPLDILYIRDLNLFLPLTKEWLDEIGKMSLGELGHGTIPPQTVQSDVDIRNLVVPPTTGRYSYASAEDGALRPFDEARVQVDPPQGFLHFLGRAPNQVKRAALRLLERNEGFLKASIWHYGEEALRRALVLEEEKTAASTGELSRSGGLFIADAKTRPPVFKEIWGEQAGVAFQGVVVKGYHARDERKGLHRVVRTQVPSHLTEPKEAGAYRIWMRDGTPLLAFIVIGAEDFFHDGPLLASYSSNESWKKPHTPRRYVGVTEDGKLLDLPHLIAEPVPFGELEHSKVYREIVADKAANGPRVGGWGIFVRSIGAAGFTASVPVYVRRVTTQNGVKHVEVASSDFESAPTTLLVFDGQARNLHGRHSHRWHLSRDYRFVPVTGAKYDQRYTDRDFMTDPRDVLEFAVRGLVSGGGRRYSIKKASQLAFADRLGQLARAAHISIEDAEASLRIAEERGRDEFWAISDEGLGKFAAESEGKKKGTDPAQETMDQVMAAQAMPPQGPTPIDMAVAEQAQNIQGQFVALQQQLQLLENVQQRANMIGGSGGAAGAPAAAAAALAGPMDPAMMGAGQPVTGPAPGQVTGPAPAGPMPQVPGQDQQHPAATMTVDDDSVDSVLSQVNPQFLEQATALQDAGAFDASALASMAQAPRLKDLAATYLPNLEKSLDNIGRVLLTLWMDESRIKEDLGDQTYVELEDNLRTVFRGLGQLILRITQNTSILRSENGPTKGMKGI